MVNLDKLAINTGNPMFAAGIIPSDSDINTYCLNTFEDPNQCSSKLDTVALKSFLQTNCVDKQLQKCQIMNLQQYLKETPATGTTSPCF